MDGYEISFAECSRSGLSPPRRTELLHRPEEKLRVDEVFSEVPLEGFDGWLFGSNFASVLYVRSNRELGLHKKCPGNP